MKLENRKLPFVILVIWSLLVSNAVQARPLQGLDAYVEEARKEWKVPGLAIAIIKDDKIIYAKGFGVRQVGRNEPIDENTVFAIGSSTKPITAASLAFLVDEGKVAWDGGVRSYMKSFELYDPYVTRNITVRDLLTHRTGVGGAGWLWSGSGFDRNEIIYRLRFQEESLGFRNRFQYNNEMFITAGEIVPAVTNVSWDEFLQQRLFKPLGMTRTNTSVRALPAMENVATPHVLIGGRLIPVEYRNIDNGGGAGNANSSVRDMAQWVRLQLGKGEYEGKRILSEKVIAEMQSPQVAIPEGEFAEMMGGAKVAAYGIGWILHEYRGKKVVQHAGAIDGMMGNVAMIPEENFGVVILTNRYPHNLGYALTLRIFDEMLGGKKGDWSTILLDQQKREGRPLEGRAPPPRMIKPNAAPPSLPLANYAGAYTNKLYGDVKVTVEGDKLVLARGGITGDLEHDDSNLFQARWRSSGFSSISGLTPIGFSIGPAGEVAMFEMGRAEYVRQAPAAGATR